MSLYIVDRNTLLDLVFAIKYPAVLLADVAVFSPDFAQQDAMHINILIGSFLILH